MEINHTEYKRCDLVKVSGRIDSATAQKLGEIMNEITGAGRYRIILDLADLDFISSAGLRILITTQKHANDTTAVRLYWQIYNLISKPPST